MSAPLVGFDLLYSGVAHLFLTVVKLIDIGFASFGCGCPMPQ